MELNKIKRLQYNRFPQSRNIFKVRPLIDTVLVLEKDGFDYPDNTPIDQLFLPFKTVIRARDYLLAQNKAYTIRVLPGEYVIHPGENMDHAGVWELEEGAKIQIIIGQTTQEYLFNGTMPVRVSGKGAISFGWPLGRLFNPSGAFTPGAIIEADVIRSFYSLLEVKDRGYTGQKCIFRNVFFECVDNRGKNIFNNADLKSQVFRFEGCTFAYYYVDIYNYAQIDFYRCSFEGVIDNPQVSIGAGTTTPDNYAASFIDCDFDLHSNLTGGILLNNSGVRLCVGRSRFNKGDFAKYSIKNDYANTVAVSAIGTARITGSIPLNNVYGATGFQYIDPNTLPYLLTV